MTFLKCSYLMSSKGPVQRTFKHDFRVFLSWSLVSNVCNVYTSRLRLRANGRNNSQQCWELLRARNVGRTVQTDSTLLRYASAITEQKKCWELLAVKFDRFLNFAQQHPTTCNRVYKRKQHVTSNNVLFVCTGLDAQRQSSTSSTVEYQSLISFSRILSRLHLLRRLRHMLNNAFHCTKYF